MVVPAVNPLAIGLKESATLAINMKVLELSRQGKETFPLGFGQSLFPVPEPIQDALRQNAGKKDLYIDKMSEQKWVVYLVQCSDKTLYCGTTNNLENRLLAHNSGKGARYTRSRRPVTLVGSSSLMTRSDALKLEFRVKRVPADKKRSELTMKRGASKRCQSQ